eukprot:1185349-Pyramimonas_sp.AAC.1
MGLQSNHHADRPQDLQHGAAHRPGRVLRRRQGVAARHRGGQQVRTVLPQDGDHPRVGQAGAP